MAHARLTEIAQILDGYGDVYNSRALTEIADELYGLAKLCIEVPSGTCEYCRGMGSDPQFGNDVPCCVCGGSGRTPNE